MNEALYILFDRKCHDIVDIINAQHKISDMLRPCGMKYVGGYSVYAPQDKGNRDNIMHDAMQILNKNKWVADMSTAILVRDCLSTISLSRIDCSGMTEPRPEKYKYYEDYYKRTGELSHDILIDENNCIMDGYITWLLANKYQNDMGMQWKFNIHKADSTIPHAKIVVGRHVNVSESDITIRGPQYFKWVYNKKEPVVPGDILKVDTRKGDVYMVVEAIRYIAGSKNCAEYRHVIEHTGMIMQEQSIR